MSRLGQTGIDYCRKIPNPVLGRSLLGFLGFVGGFWCCLLSHNRSVCVYLLEHRLSFPPNAVHLRSEHFPLILHLAALHSCARENQNQLACLQRSKITNLRTHAPLKPRKTTATTARNAYHVLTHHETIRPAKLTSHSAPRNRSSSILVHRLFPDIASIRRRTMTNIVLSGLPRRSGRRHHPGQGAPAAFLHGLR